MKKITVYVVLFMAIWVVSPLLSAQTQPNTEPCKFSLSLGVGVRNIANSDYKDVYGNGAVTYNLDLGYKFNKNIEFFLHTDILKKDGELTYTKENTTLKIFPIELGVRNLFSSRTSGKFLPYLGLGAGYYMIKEENTIGNFDEKRIGFFFEGGLRAYLMKSVFIDLKLKDVILQTESKVKLGGFSYSGGIGFSF